jgi:hypothetical protein
VESTWQTGRARASVEQTIPGEKAYWERRQLGRLYVLIRQIPGIESKDKASSEREIQQQ